jgi:predicted nucleic acid-binding protein
MIILDTNVVSEPIKLNSDVTAQKWLDNQVAETLYLTSTSLAELLVGIEVLPLRKRRATLSATVAEVVEKLFGDRILPFDRSAATVYAQLHGRARASGRALSFADAQIAAIATVRGFAVATRDTAAFEGAGVRVINPWAQ